MKLKIPTKSQINEYFIKRKLYKRYKKMLSAYNVKIGDINQRRRKSVFHLYLTGLSDKDFSVLHTTLSLVSKNKIGDDWRRYITENGEPNIITKKYWVWR